MGGIRFALFAIRVVVTTGDDPTSLAPSGCCGPIRGFVNDGDLTVLSLPDGTYKVGVQPSMEDPATWWYPGTAAWDSAGAITIQDHREVTGIEIRLP